MRMLTYDETTHPFMASKTPNSSFFIRTPEAKAYRVKNGRGGELLKRLPEGPLFGVEVGVNQGYLSTFLLEERLDLTLWMVDIWKHSPGLIAYGMAMEKTGFADHRRMFMRMKSGEAAKLIPDGVFDFVFIDADHSYEAVKEDIQVWRPKLKPGGLLCGHDIHMKQTWKAVDELVPAYERGEDATWFEVKEKKDEIRESVG